MHYQYSVLNRKYVTNAHTTENVTASEITVQADMITHTIQN